MPRLSNGNWQDYTPGNPVVAGTTIAVNWWNNTYNDLGAALQDSLSRSGNGGMLAPLGMLDGSSSLPGLTFQSETNSGLYRPTGGEIDVVIQGRRVGRWTQSTGAQYSADNGATWKFPLYADLAGQTMLTGGIDFAAGTLTVGAVAVAGPVFYASGSSGTFSNPSTSYVQITNHSITFTATGALVQVLLIPDASGNAATVTCSNSNPGAVFYQGVIGVSIDNGATFIGESGFGYTVIGTPLTDAMVHPVTAFQFWMSPAAGSVTVKAFAKAVGGAGTPSVSVNYAKLCVIQYFPR